jgi:polysaccharide biosynthesis/export protein
LKTRSSIQRIFTVTLMACSVSHPAAGQRPSVSNPISGAQLATDDTSPKTTLGGSDDTLHKRERRYTIHPSDTLQLGFTLSPEFNQNVTVQPDGYISLLEVGDIPAAGRTLPELAEAIKMAYSKILHDPVISVIPTDFEKPYIVVGGQVGKPGKFDWRGDVTVTQAIAVAGGFTDASKHSQVLLFRRVSDQWTQARVINVKQMLNSRNLQEDPVLQPGDMLFVPKNTLSKVKPFLPTSAVGAYYNPAVF